MGVLDDAIREHLELKRQHGARDSEIKELEDEAFGPPSRPGDPDFPARETDEGSAVAADAPPAAGEAPVVEGEAPVVEEPPAAEHELVPPPAADEQPPTQLMETAEEAAPEAPPSPIETETSGGGLFDQAVDDDKAVDAEATEDDQAMEADQAMEDDLGVEDLDLKLDETEEVLPSPDEPAVPEVEEEIGGQPEREASADAGEESVSTVGLPTEEHPYPGEELAEEESAELPLEVEVESEELALEPDEATDEEDVLEETPEFLREKPEDEELWFEQGEPKDFDFEDEEEEK
jgi:hypothetical protein